MTHKSFIASLLAVILFVLTGCSNGALHTEDYSEQISGYWEYEEFGYSEYLYFDGNGNGVLTVLFNGLSLGSYDYSYRVDGDQIHVSNLGETNSMNVVDVNDSELVLEVDGEQLHLSKISEQDYNSSIAQANDSSFNGGNYDEQWASQVQEIYQQSQQIYQQAQQAAQDAQQSWQYTEQSGQQSMYDAQQSGQQAEQSAQQAQQAAQQAQDAAQYNQPPVMF